MIKTVSYTNTLLHAKSLYYNTCLEVPWYIPKALVELGESFVLYLFSDHTVSKKFTISLENYLENERHSFIVIAVNICTEEILKTFSVAILPQLRLFSKGKELQRIHGSKSYDELAKILTFS